MVPEAPKCRTCASCSRWESPQGLCAPPLLIFSGFGRHQGRGNPPGEAEPPPGPPTQPSTWRAVLGSFISLTQSEGWTVAGAFGGAGRRALSLGRGVIHSCVCAHVQLCVCMCVPVCMLSCLSRVRLFVTLWTGSQAVSSVHGDSPGKNTGVGCHALIQGIFPTLTLTQPRDQTQVSHTAGRFFTI